MRIPLLAVVAVVLVVPLATHSQENAEKQFKTAKIGDYVAHKVILSFSGRHFELGMKQTVTAKNEKKVTMQTITSAVGGKPSTKEETIDLTVPYDPIAAITKGQWKKTGEGKEKVTIGTKTYDCDWITASRVKESGGAKVDEDMKLWLNNSVLTGLVKMTINSTPRNTYFLIQERTEITESGSAN